MYNNILITGGAGFIGINAAEYFLKQHKQVVILDNFSRRGSKENIAWLSKTQAKKNLKILALDVTEHTTELQNAVFDADLVLHLAGQVAVTTSVKNPREDFAINAGGTLNLLEIARYSDKNPIFIYSSTNKIYGNLNNVKIVEKKTRYEFQDLRHGISEDFPLDFYSPYGCSKGAADQYVRDYSRIYGLRTIVFRQSCIYGPHQFGIEDQGWLSWFMISALKKQPISIFGNGKQVRDVLYVTDLIRAYELATEQIHATAGEIYNIGGGMENSISISHEYLPMVEKFFGRKCSILFADQRAGDQRLYVSDIRKSKKHFGWTPKVSMNEGIQKLYNWIIENTHLFIS